MLVLAACSSGIEAKIAPTAGSPASCPVAPAPGAADGAAAERVLTATQTFLATLDDAQRMSATAERSPANLAQWSDLPDELFDRAGLRMDGLSAEQQAAALAILQGALSSEGYAQVTEITAADGVLAAQDDRDLDLGADHYWIRILGTPAATGEWTVQYGGHNLAVNVTIDGSEMTLAPTLWGVQPASYVSAGTTAEPLCGETTKAFAFVNSLDATQQQAAMLATPVKEIILGAGQDGRTLPPEGVSGSSLTEGQKALLLDLIDEWIRPLNPDAAAAKLAAAEQNLDQTTFAWSGSTTIGQPIYYRLQGPTFTIEFAHQQGQGVNSGGVTHIHSIYREPGNDYGAQLSS
jgi:hypothetical protein